ncbi:MAG TPA: hypothetical protein VMT53_23635 [Terriglobales bacterium]|nr:hypothetical protein [Terriglobales bacterium]
MTRAVKTVMALITALALLSALASAETKAKSDTKQEHHGKLSKAAFWKHGKKTDNNAKPVNTKAQPKAQPPAPALAKTKAQPPAPKKTDTKKSAAKIRPVKSTSTKHGNAPKIVSAKSPGKVVSKPLPAASKAKTQAKAKQETTTSAKK